MNTWQRVEPTRKTAGVYRSIVAKTFQLTDGRKIEFDTFGEEDVCHAAIIGITGGNQVVIARQFRPGPEKYMEELPGGTIEAGEDVVAGVMREFQEETGYTSSNVTHLGTIHKDGYMNATWHYYLAINCTLTGRGQQLDEEEDIEVKLVSIRRLIQNARQGRMTDIEAVFLAYDYLKTLS